MAEDSVDKTPSPLGSLIDSAKDGGLAVNFNPDVRINAEEFVYIDRDCNAFKDFIRVIQRTAREISSQQKWGLGEDQDILTSAQTIVHRFRSKAAVVDDGSDTDNNVADILEEHYKIVDDIQTLHKTIAQKLIDTDEEFAARYNELSAHMPPSGITANQHVAGPYSLSNGGAF